MTKNNYLYFLVEGGTTLDICRAHIREKLDVLADQKAMLAELGEHVEWSQSPIDGKVWGVRFKDRGRHPEFTAPNKHGVCGPKKKSEWAAKFKAGRGWDKGGYGIAKALGVPTNIEYRRQGEEGGGMMSASPTFDAGVGFLWLDQDNGPFALYVYDIAARIADLKAREGYLVDEPANSWVPAFDGARQIHEAEWELLVAQHKVDELKAKKPDAEQMQEAA
jgi:hypothetical protein